MNLVAMAIVLRVDAENRQLMREAAHEPALRLVMAGGTGGHIFPGLAVAEALRERGWRVHWLGAPGSMERAGAAARLCLEAIDFGGVRGKGLHAGLLPLRLLRAFWQASGGAPRAARRGGGPGRLHHLPGRLMAWRWASRWCCTSRTRCRHGQQGAGRRGRPRVHRVSRRAGQGGAVGGQPAARRVHPGARPAERFAGRSGPLRLLVVGGSLGAQALNDVVPQALALLPAEQRPQVTHQSGAKQIDALRANYQAAGVQAELRPSSTTWPAPLPRPTWSSAAPAPAP
jgi:UDP-N-acetylglucosamine--N-acetylmuramyl-(pentapeptide) pyrophosphoryl-undecaprenol N-acetylglucosamine transferase